LGHPRSRPSWTEAGKRIYVWFEAVIGYLSAPIEWSKLSNQKERGATGGQIPRRSNSISSARTTSSSTHPNGLPN